MSLPRVGHKKYSGFVPCSLSDLLTLGNLAACLKDNQAALWRASHGKEVRPNVNNQQGTDEASYQLPSEQVILQADPPTPAKLAETTAPAEHLD